MASSGQRLAIQPGIEDMGLQHITDMEMHRPGPGGAQSLATATICEMVTGTAG